MIDDRPARWWPRVAVEDVLSLVIGVVVLAVEGVFIQMGWLPAPWR